MSVVRVENSDQRLNIVLEGIKPVTVTGSPLTVDSRDHHLARRPFVRALFSTDDNEYYRLNQITRYGLPGNPPAELNVWTDRNKVYFGVANTNPATFPTIYVKYWLYFTEGST